MEEHALSLFKVTPIKPHPSSWLESHIWNQHILIHIYGTTFHASVLCLSNPRHSSVHTHNSTIPKTGHTLRESMCWHIFTDCVREKKGRKKAIFGLSDTVRAQLWFWQEMSVWANKIISKKKKKKHIVFHSRYLFSHPSSWKQHLKLAKNETSNRNGTAYFMTGPGGQSVCEIYYCLHKCISSISFLYCLSVSYLFLIHFISLCLEQLFNMFIYLQNLFISKKSFALTAVWN